jgi:hypothetical protein
MARTTTPTIAEREQECRGVEVQQAALLLLAIDHVEGIEEGRNPRVRAPQRDQKTYHEGDAERVTVLGDDQADLLSDEFQHAAGQNPGKKGQVRPVRTGIGKEPVERHDCGDCGEDRQQGKERDSARGGQDPVLRDRPEHAPEDVPPAARRDLRGGARLASPAKLAGAGQIVRWFAVGRPLADAGAPILCLFIHPSHASKGAMPGKLRWRRISASEAPRRSNMTSQGSLLSSLQQVFA